MENETKLSPEQLKNLILAFKNTDTVDEKSLDVLLNRYLSDSQSEKVKKVLADPQLLKSIITSPQALTVIEQLKKAGKGDEY